ncbi:MAG TPA: serine/threonine-protein kinase [Myxococcales bacterium]|jgi:serine/threonine protein kinase
MAGPPGQSFGKYLLLDRIAAGGMAEIFRAKYVAAAGVTKSVVIKRILPHYAGNPAFVSMFTNEAKIAMSLAHGNIAQVFDFGEIDGEYFLAMEFVNGQSLSRLSRGAREMGYWVPLPIAAHIISEVCAGLHYAHTLKDDAGKPLGIVHRDVSPQNVIVSYEGQVKLVDFGIAKIRSAGKGETEHGAMKGKYVYFSPEQARAKPLDGRSDVFAAGIVLYELITGKRPFEGKMIEVLSKITKGEFVPPSLVNPEVPRELETIVLRALALKPDDRYASAVEMQDALRHYQHEADPNFSTTSVAHLSRFVCRDELEREGVKVEIPPEFDERMLRWRAPPKSSRESIPTSAATSSGRREKTNPGDRVDTEAGLPDEAARRSRRVMAAVGVLVLGVVAGLAVSLGLLRKVYTLEIVTAPPGAAVMLDGRDLKSATPTRLEGVSAEDPHELELSMVGRKPVKRTLEPSKQRRVVVEVTMEPEGGEPSSVSAPDGLRHVADARDPVDDPVAVVAPAAWPETKQVVLRSQSNAVVAAATPAARLRLDPTRTYRLAVEGSAEVSSGAQRRTVREVAWFAEKPGGVGGEALCGVLTPQGGAVVTGARALYAFAVRRPGEEGAGELKVRLVDPRAKKPLVLPVDVSSAAFVPGDRLPRMMGLDPSVAYSLSVSGQASLGASGQATRLLYVLDGESPEVLGALGTGGSKVVRGAKGLWLVLLDDDLADNDGDLVVNVSPAKAP